MSEPRKILMSEELALHLGADRVDWGEPDAEGFYTPTFSRKYPGRLRQAAQDIADRSPIDTDGETLDTWCHYCQSFKADVHALTCEWLVLRGALEAT